MISIAETLFNMDLPLNCFEDNLQDRQHIWNLMILREGSFTQVQDVESQRGLFGCKHNLFRHGISFVLLMRRMLLAPLLSVKLFCSVLSGSPETLALADQNRLSPRLIP